MTAAGFAETVWPQFGASLDALGNAIRHCPDDLWGDRSRRLQPWYLVYHTLFWLDLYLTGSVEGFAPPEPFTLGELEANVSPDRVYTKDEMLGYLAHGREKCRRVLDSLTDESALRTCSFGWGEVPYGELLLYNMRHVQHGVAQMNLVLRETIDSAPGWVARAKE